MRKHGAILLILVLLVFLAGLLLPAVSEVREAARQAQCANNLRQLQLAILNYESTYGHFPTDTVIINEHGEEIRTSWRAQILPFN